MHVLRLRLGQGLQSKMQPTAHANVFDLKDLNSSSFGCKYPCQTSPVFVEAIEELDTDKQHAHAR